MRSVLITGGTGYFGQGMVRRLLEIPDEGVYRICVYSRDEAKQATMRASLDDPDQRIRWFVGDVRDQARLRHAMQDIELVIHAAALKRVETGEYDTSEIVKTNVLGTMNVIEAAKAESHGSRHIPMRVIALSTDKACSPANAYGASKLLMEKLVLGANNARGTYGPRFSITRYGNVAGSTGSVIPTWRAALREDRPVYITDPNATRFWMTQKEAIDLVLKTAGHMHGGELVIPELPAYRLGDLFEAMCANDPSGHHNMQTIGLGRGEKLHERMKEDGPDSSQVRRMTVDELREALKSV